MARINGPILHLEVRRGDEGELEVCRHGEDGKPTEEWREPSTEELAALLPGVVERSLGAELGVSKQFDRMIDLMERQVARDSQPLEGVPDDGSDAVFDGGEDIFGGARGARGRKDEFAALPSPKWVGAQFVPHLRHGGVVVAPDKLDALDPPELVLRFSHNTGLPEVGVCGRGVATPTPWREPTEAEARDFGVKRGESAQGMVGLFRKVAEDVVFVGFTVADGVVNLPSGMRERIPLSVFDTLCNEDHPLAMLKAFPNGEYPLFGAVNVGHLDRTNMVWGSCLPSDNTAIVREIVADIRLAPGFIGAARAAAIDAVRAGLRLEVMIGMKPFAPMPPEPVGKILGAGEIGGDAGFRYPIGGEDGLQIPARQSFGVKAYLSAAAREILSIPGSVCRVWLGGTLTRDVQ